MAQIVAVASLKGGVSKTTLAVNLACQLAADGARVAVVDADPQASAADWSAAGALPVPVVALPLDDAAQMAAWMQRVRGLDAELVVVDLPPQAGAATLAALMLADLLLIPATPSLMDLRAAARAIELWREARQERGEDRPHVLLVPSRVDRRTYAGREVEAVLHDHGLPVAPAIGLRQAFVDAATAGTWIGQHAPRSVAHVEIQALAAIVRRMTSGKA